MNVREALQIVKESIIQYDFKKDIEYARSFYPKADIKFRVFFMTNSFNLSTDYNNFHFCENENDLKELIDNYIISSMKNLNEHPDYDLSIYVSIDAFIPVNSNDNEEIIDFNDVIDGNVYDDNEGNSWISEKCYEWMLGYKKPIECFWYMLGLGTDPKSHLYLNY